MNLKYNRNSSLIRKKIYWRKFDVNSFLTMILKISPLRLAQFRRRVNPKDQKTKNFEIIKNVCFKFFEHLRNPFIGGKLLFF